MEISSIMISYPLMNLRNHRKVRKNMPASRLRQTSPSSRLAGSPLLGLPTEVCCARPRPSHGSSCDWQCFDGDVISFPWWNQPCDSNWKITGNWWKSYCPTSCLVKCSATTTWASKNRFWMPSRTCCNGFTPSCDPLCCFLLGTSKKNPYYSQEKHQVLTWWFLQRSPPQNCPKLVRFCLTLEFVNSQKIQRKWSRPVSSRWP